MFKTYHSVIIYTALINNIKKIARKIGKVNFFLALLNNCEMHLAGFVL